MTPFGTIALLAVCSLPQAVSFAPPLVGILPKPIADTHRLFPTRRYLTNGESPIPAKAQDESPIAEKNQLPRERVAVAPIPPLVNADKPGDQNGTMDSANESALDSRNGKERTASPNGLLESEPIEVLAKKEEPGDKQAVIASIKKFQASVEPMEPSIPLDTIIERALDTAEDAFLHLRRVPYDFGFIEESELNRAKRQTVVVLGSGWAAHALLKVADTYKLRIIVVSPSNHFVFTPMVSGMPVMLLCVVVVADLRAWSYKLTVALF